MIPKRILVPLIFCFLWFLWRSAPSPNTSSVKSPGNPLATPPSTMMGVTIRKAVPSDLDAITEIGMNAFPGNPQWAYRFPYRLKYPEDHLKFCRLRFADYLENARIGVYEIMLAEAPMIGDPTKRKVVSMSMWQLPGTHVEKPSEEQNGIKAQPPTDHFERRDADPKRMKAFRVALATAKAKYFNTQYGEKQIQLMILATLPEYRRMGAGSALSRWGMEYAKEEGLAVTLFASPDGFKLYSKLGFKKVGEAETRVDGEEDRIVNRVMVLEPTDNV